MFWKRKDKLTDNLENSVSMETKENNDNVLGIAPNIPKENVINQQEITQDSFLNSTIGKMSAKPMEKKTPVRDITVKIGSRWQHFQGDIVTIEAIVRHSENNEVLVIYKYNDELWAKPINLFLANQDVSNNPDNKTGQKYPYEEIK